MRNLIAALILPLLYAIPTSACGFCIEDKIATVYDYTLVTKALAAGERVVFSAITYDGTNPPAHLTKRAFQSVEGIDAGSVKISEDGLAAAFAYRPDRFELERIMNALRSKLQKSGSRIEVLKTMEPTD